MAMVRVTLGILLLMGILQAEQRVLVVAPHPDDDILGCGGSIAQHIRQKNNVFIVFMTSGEKGNKKIDKQELAQLREKEALKAENVLGCSNCIFLRNPDGNLKLTDITLAQMITILEQIQPDIIYIPHKADDHKDHMMTYRIVVAALKKQREQHKNMPIVLCYEVWAPLQRYTFTENISREMPLKLAALREHATQLASLAYDQAIEGLNRYRGIMSAKRCRYAECFYEVSEYDLQDDNGI